MKPLLALGLLLSATLRADTLSGPSRSTLQQLPFGTLYYEPAKLGACQVETTSEGYRFTSGLGEVAIKGNDVNGYRLLWGKEVLTIQQSNGEGKRSFAGPALDQIPYLGRGLFIPFHGVGIFVDISQFFPLPELSEWTDWKPILEP